MAEERLSPKDHAKVEKIFFLFGSVSKLVSPVRPDEWNDLAEHMWAWSICKVSRLVESYYEEATLDREVEKVETQPPPSPPSDKLEETDTITITAFAAQSQGQRKDGTPWTRYQVKDEYHRNYYTFHSGYELGESYSITWHWQGEDDRKYRFIPEKALLVKTPTTPREPAEYNDENIPF
jgi:hypothetical protein